MNKEQLIEEIAKVTCTKGGFSLNNHLDKIYILIGKRPLMISKVGLLTFLATVVLLVVTIPQMMSAQSGRNNIKVRDVHRVYNYLMNPREHPDYNRHRIRPPDWSTFNNRTRFMTLRGFKIEDDQIVDYTEKIEKYTKTYDLGDILWISYPHIFTRNFGDLVAEIKKRDLFLFDIWGYVPGSGPGGYWQQFKPPAGVLAILESELGEHWLGMDNGEQDGRYVGGYAPQMYPSSSDRFQQYLNFQRHFERLCNELGNKMSTLVSLNFGHYFLKEGIYTTIGAETAQALPNNQVYYSFIRGAGKQYGVPWFGNASVYNRWGYKTYGSEGKNFGPTKGTSLNLLKRLIYSHILYNSIFVGFESGYFFQTGDLSPIGRIQQAAKRWVNANGQPGVMQTPIAIMVDFFSGWTFPRHLYTGNVYRVWGNLPYEAGDYLTDGIFDMIYPGYQDSSYFHDESGFITPTPYGDAADCILSDVPGWLLERYPLLVVGGKLSGGAEVRNKLQSYVQRGGRLFITAGSLATLPGGLAGIQVSGPPVYFRSGKVVDVGEEKLSEDFSFELYPLELPSSAHIIAKCGDLPAAVEMPCDKGIVTVFCSPFGVCAESAVKEVITSQIDKPLLKPYPLLKHVRVILDKAFQTQMLFEVGEGLSFITCRKGAGLYTLGIFNNSLEEKPFKIICRCGAIKSIRELNLDQSEKDAAGYLPYGFENADIGRSDDRNIAGGDVRIFSIKIREENVEQIPHIVPPPYPRGCALPLREIKSIKEEILARPSFFQHFDKIVVDWKYLRQRERDALQQESGWISRQKLGVIIDLTSGINLYPDLRLVNNLERDYLKSMSSIEDVMDKMEIIGSRDLILSLHRFIENNFTPEQALASFNSTLGELCKNAERHQITIYLRTCFNKPPWNLKEAVKIIDRIGAENLRLAPSTALLLAGKENINVDPGELKEKIGMWIVSAPQFDISGNLWNPYAPIAGVWTEKDIADIIAIAPDVPVILGGVYHNQDEEYLDSCALDRLMIQARGK